MSGQWEEAETRCPSLHPVCGLDWSGGQADGPRSDATSVAGNVTDCYRSARHTRSHQYDTCQSREAVNPQSGGVPPEPPGTSMLLAALSTSESTLISTTLPNLPLIKWLFNMMAFPHI